MGEKPNPKNIPKRLKSWLEGANGKKRSLLGRDKVSGRFKSLDFDFRNIELKNLSQYSGWIRWGLIVLVVFLLADAVSSVVGLFIRPVYPPIPKKPMAYSPVQTPSEDYESILRRNMFNVEGKIPDPFDQGLLDCLSQAKPSTQRILLQGTIVMNDERQSVALIQEEGSPIKIAVKKDEPFFDGKFLAMKVDRKKFCFQVRATQDFEYIEIPEDNLGMGVSAPSLDGGRGADGITPLSENDYAVKQSFLEKNLLNLKDILETARAVPYIDQLSGKFQGFLIQSIDATSPFAQLGIRQGDLLTGVNDIVLDNAGKGLEAFQRLRSSPKITLKVVRDGQEKTLNYDVK